MDGDAVSLTVVLTTPACPLRDEIDQAVRSALADIGAQQVALDWDANVPVFQQRDGPEPIPGVKNIIAVASNKGGVGKSTVAANLSVALAQAGAAVGLLDADITGPNIPTMFGLPAGFQADSEQGLHPVARHGVKVISLGFIVPPNAPVVWRGPMLGSGVRQLLHDVTWGDLDYMIIDLPPGTSDATMTMAQSAPIAGAVIVSTPQPVALEDAGKAVTMFEKLNVPVFGIVENMSYFLTPDTGLRVGDLRAWRRAPPPRTSTGSTSWAKSRWSPRFAWVVIRACPLSRRTRMGRSARPLWPSRKQSQPR